MIDFKQKVRLGGLPQKIHVRGRDGSNPVLLFLHGGPGVCNRHSVMTEHEDLTDSFTLVAWDQRGSGGSFWGSRVEELSVDRMVEDAAELVAWLCERLGKEKVFLLGGSWGSMLGTLLAHRHPERVAAYVGFGQVVNGGKNEELSFRFALEAARAAGDAKSVAALERVGPPAAGQYRGGLPGMMVQRRIMMRYGGYSRDPRKRSYFRSFVVPVLFSGEYSAPDILGLMAGHKRVLAALWPEVGAVDLASSCPSFQVPYFVFDGKLDMNTPAELVGAYLEAIRAPVKELVWFEESGHNPMSDEKEKFERLLRERLLPIAAAGRGI